MGTPREIVAWTGECSSHGSVEVFKPAAVQGPYLCRLERFRITMAVAFIDSRRTSKIRMPPAATV
jgi:hypothetical protein